MTTLPQVDAPPPPRTQDRIWHDVLLPDDVAHVRAMARRAVERHLAPVAREIAQREESRESFPWEAFRGLASEGCFAVPFAAPHGAGLQHPMLATCITTEEIAYASSSMAGVYDGQCILNARALSFASDDVRDQVLPALISGASAFAFATTEPDASSDLSPEAMKTVATAGRPLRRARGEHGQVLRHQARQRPRARRAAGPRRLRLRAPRRGDRRDPAPGGALARREDPRDLRGRQRGPAVGHRAPPDRARHHRVTALPTVP